MSDTALLSIEHLKKAYGDNVVLEDISLSVKRGEVIVVIGPSGCGKSTFLRCINALEPIQGGTIKVDGKEITMTAKNYTSSDDGKEMRANICNTFVNSLPEDAHNADGVIAADNKDYAPVIIDTKDFKSWTTIEVNFTVSGTGKTKEDAGTADDSSKAEDASKADTSADSSKAE